MAELDRPIVLLDAGGTLISIDYDRIREVAARCETFPDDAALDEAEARARAWADAGVRARLSTRELWDGYFGRILERVGLPETHLAACLDALWEMHHERGLWRRPIPGAREVLERLRAAGKRLAVVSNAEGQVERDLDEAGFGGLLETVVDSHRVGVAKPDPGIFAIALGRLGATPEEAVHVGDVPAYDVDGARAVGLPAILLDPHGIHEEVEAVRIRSLEELPRLVGAGPGGGER
jgi:putative hydrolase of the HAD superfamily